MTTRGASSTKPLPAPGGIVARRYSSQSPPKQLRAPRRRGARRIEMQETQIGLFDAIYTQRAIRSFKTDPVPDDVIRKLIEAASKAPSAGNVQPWAFVVVRHPKTIAAIGEYARRAFDTMYQRALSRGDEAP